MKIAVLISGGVDSAVVVHKLYSEGHDLDLFYIRIGLDNDEGDCSAEEDIEMCTLIARKYNLPLKVVSLHEEYWEYVMQYALDTVKTGLTPNPDMMCNKIIKFGFFEERWGKDYDYTATGHYAGVDHSGELSRLLTAPDPVKDQTDFLARISQKQLSHLLFPLGSLTKEEVREMAAQAGLPNAKRKDSQGICFLGKIDYDDFIARKLGERPGPVIEIETGKKIGTHRGYWFYTIGQRKGLGLSGGPWYVVRKNVKDNAIYVSRGYNTPMQFGHRLHLKEMHWISSPLFQNGSTSEVVSFKNRHTPVFIDGTLERISDDEYLLHSSEDVQGIAPGQFAVIYSPDRKECIGSAMIVAPQKKKKVREKETVKE